MSLFRFTLCVLAFFCIQNVFGEGNHGSGPLISQAQSRVEAKPPAEKSKEVKNKRVLMVMFSGFKSCSDDDFLSSVQESSIKTIKEKDPEHTVDVVRFCYDRLQDAIRVRLPGQENLSEEGKSLRDTLAFIAEMQKEYGSTVVMGHSWGGWSVLRALEGMEKPVIKNPNPLDWEFKSPFSDGVHGGWEDGSKDAKKSLPPKLDPRSEVEAEKDALKQENDAQGGYWIGYEEGYEETKEKMALKAVPPLKVDVLITIDPISARLPDGCNPGTVIRGSKGCKEFPSEIDQQKVAAGVKGKWLNYYQTEQERVHSGPAMGASNPASSQLATGDHGTIKSDPRVAREISEAIASALDP